MRYSVVEIGCLECSNDGDCEPREVLRTDSLEEVNGLINDPKIKYSTQVDCFAFDFYSGAIIRAERS